MLDLQKQTGTSEDYCGTVAAKQNVFVSGVKAFHDGKCTGRLCDL